MVVVVVARWVSTADNDKDNWQAMECEANRLAVVWHELQIRSLPSQEYASTETGVETAACRMMGVCHLPRHDQVLTDEEGCVRSKGVMIRTNIGMKKRQTSRMRMESGREVFGQHFASKRASDGKARCIQDSLMAAMCSEQLLRWLAAAAPVVSVRACHLASIYRLLYSVKGFKRTKV